MFWTCRRWLNIPRPATRCQMFMCNLKDFLCAIGYFCVDHMVAFGTLPSVHLWNFSHVFLVCPRFQWVSSKGFSIMRDFSWACFLLSSCLHMTFFVVMMIFKSKLYGLLLSFLSYLDCSIVIVVNTPLVCKFLYFFWQLSSMHLLSPLVCALSSLHNGGLHSWAWGFPILFYNVLLTSFKK